jgi:hypothetical protein
MIQFAPISKNEMAYEEAILYCQFCTYNGHTDWRMPTKEESSDYRYNIWGWHNNSIPLIMYVKHTVTPVRDV